MVRFEQKPFFNLIFQKNIMQIQLLFYKNVVTNFMTEISFNMRMIIGREGIFFMMQSWFRGQSDKKKLAKAKEKGTNFRI